MNPGFSFAHGYAASEAAPPRAPVEALLAKKDFPDAFAVRAPPRAPVRFHVGGWERISMFVEFSRPLQWSLNAESNSSAISILSWLGWPHELKDLLVMRQESLVDFVDPCDVVGLAAKLQPTAPSHS